MLEANYPRYHSNCAPKRAALALTRHTGATTAFHRTGSRTTFPHWARLFAPTTSSLCRRHGVLLPFQAVFYRYYRTKTAAPCQAAAGILRPQKYANRLKESHNTDKTTTAANKKTTPDALQHPERMSTYYLVFIFGT